MVFILNLGLAMTGESPDLTINLGGNAPKFCIKIVPIFLSEIAFLSLLSVIKQKLDLEFWIICYVTMVNDENSVNRKLTNICCPMLRSKNKLADTQV